MIPAHRRIESLTTAMAANGYDALVCCWPQHILALAGYAPILGESAVVFLPGGESTLIIPEAERSFAGGSWAHRLETYESATLQYILSPEEALKPLLVRVCEQAGISRGVLGIEAASGIKPTAYPAMYDIAFAA
ncbi:MAG TPA: aminopeptidase P family N-terminal domain-containing protein, partial [Armatimonadota bacterium]|nr:aminopeptidase P family N-terminal domain-containing protein [Armatimonadota bacterium]